MNATPDMFGHKIREQAPVYCIYHKVDFDGECSAAIVMRNTVDCTLVGYNYDDPFPWYVFEQANRRPICYMVDVSLPIKDMIRLAGMCDLIWIDHHKSKIAEAVEAGFNPKGARDTQFAACELSWGWFHGNMANIPIAVHLLGRYDAWDHKDPRTLPFQFYLRAFKNTEPTHAFWDWLFKLPEAGVQACVREGDLILQYQQARDLKAITQFGFPARMFGYNALACNSLPGGSQMFDVHPDAKDYQLFVMFYWRHLVGWTISLYSNDKAVDVGDIARRMGGGGHRGAAGYTVSTLPEELQQHHDYSYIKGVY